MKQRLAGDMRGRTLEEWIDTLGLEQVDDPQIQKPIYRKVSFGPMALTGEIEELISSQIRELREIREMPRTVLAPLLGLHHQVLSRYEKATSKLTVARLIHLCEVLDTSPMELLYPVAPHLFGETAQEAEMTKSIYDKLRTLDALTLAAISNFIQHLKTKPDSIDGSGSQDAARAAS
ncbi:helix-turn-helix transcriptional regulator (plasmid) [Brucella anthropi]|uniref:Helix-turn-helix domain protein n=2 Tax=Brucella anthropi TaxID=529 RepID=A6X7T3_BRUA4|nr:helix-turn-helix transcriptional regulator [Brucella anthropi]ABS17287.1 helix-turn-helix domain protein [Brucella anthropi ATCC 49188]KAB2730979.1 helix-turn-helix transcriptional regulator [Brucella anthropi]QQC26804.1 helix-turn-helix transcriptional regulator [Brucella anthropi]